MGQVKPGSGLARTHKARMGQVWTAQIWTGQVGTVSSQVRIDHVRTVQLKTGWLSWDRSRFFRVTFVISLELLLKIWQVPA